MKLKQVRIQNYRSIVDSGSIDIENSVTVLIGKNEQGKTNILRAIASFNDDKTYSPNDLPNHLRPSLDEKDPQTIPIVTIFLEPETEDAAALKATIDSLEPSEILKCVRNYGNNYAYFVVSANGTERPLAFSSPDVSKHIAEIDNTTNGLSVKLTAHAARLPTFAPYVEQAKKTIEGLSSAQHEEGMEFGELVKTFTTALKGLPGQDAAIQEDISLAIKEVDVALGKILGLQQTNQLHIFRKLLPYFIFHSAKVDQIPNDVSIVQFIQGPDSTSRGMLNLCRAAGLSPQKIKQLAGTTDTAQRASYEDHHQGTISGGLNEFWTQETYHVHFRIDSDRLSVTISDDTYGRRIQPSDRSEGFQWYLSFYCSLLNETATASKTVMLLDNPGLELHVDGQRDIKRFLEDKLSFDSQIMYVTHSPAMIDPFNLSQLRRVDLLPNQKGTKVSPVFRQGQGDFDLLEPVRSAIGTNLAASLMINDFNILVEGASDKPILDSAFKLLQKGSADKLLINGSISESKECILARFYSRTKLPFVILLDADSGGRDLKKELRKWQIPELNIIVLDEIITGLGRDFAIEDILSEAFYFEAVKKAYPSNQIEMPRGDTRKRVNLYEEEFKAKHRIGFSKRRVAETIGKEIALGHIDKETEGNLKKVTDMLLERLKGLLAPC